MSTDFNFERFYTLFKKMCLSSGGLLGPILQSLEPMRKMAQEMDDAGRGLALSVNPTVAMAIQDLKILYHAVDVKARLYVISCKDVAYYVCESGVLEAIADDLKKRKSTEELTYFLDGMMDYLKGCKSCLEQFNTIQVQLGKEVKQSSDQWDGEAKRKEKEEKRSLYISRGLGFAGAILTAGSVAGVAVASTIVCPPVALALGAGALAGAVGATASFSVAGAFAVERGISEVKKKVFEDAAKQAVQLYEALAVVEIKIGAMEGNLKSVRTYVGGEHSDGRSGLTEMVARASSGDCRLNVWRIETDLKLLREQMEKTLKEARDYLK